MLNLYIIYLFILLTLFSNIWVFFRLRKKLTKKETFQYLYLLISITGWAVTNALADILREQETALLFAQISIFFPLNIINALMGIVDQFPRIITINKENRIFKICAVITGLYTIASAFLFRSQYNITNFSVVQNSPADFSPGPLYYALIALAVVFFVAILLHWKSRLPLYTPTQKRQISTISLTLAFVYVSMSLGLIVLPMLGLSMYSPFMFLSLSLLAFVINKSLWIKVAVVDIREELTRLFGVLLSALVILAIWSFAGVVDIEMNIVGRFLTSLSIVIVINGFYGYFNRIYEKRQVQSQEEVGSFIDKTTSITSTEELTQVAYSTLEKMLKPESIVLELIRQEHITDIQEKITHWWKLRSRIPVINKEVLIESYFDRENNKEITKEIYNHMQKNKISIIIPLASKNSLQALINIYNTDDVLGEAQYNSLSLMSNSMSVSLNRTILYEELQEINKSLKTRVDEQTTELQEKVRLLEEARKKEADMIDIMGHELRTPATVVKLNADLLRQFSDKVTQDKQSFDKYVGRIKDAVETEIKLINTLLSSAKLEGDKVEINKEKIDISKEIEMAIHGEEEHATQKGIKIINEVPQDTPAIYADHARTVEIFNNLISNAVKYTDEGCINVYAKEDEKYLHISIQDTGRGIAPEDLKRLGTKFFRTKTYIQSEEKDDFDIVRPGGTGLGLYVTFGLVQKMGGKIDIQSELGKGSTFTVSLEKYTNQEEHKMQKDTTDMFAKMGLKRDS